MRSRWEWNEGGDLMVRAKANDRGRRVIRELCTPTRAWRMRGSNHRRLLPPSTVYGERLGRQQASEEGVRIGEPTIPTTKGRTTTKDHSSTCLPESITHGKELVVP